jgi:ribosomal protein S18 acetylase RimI-like enzyme
MSAMQIRPARDEDRAAIWRILEPTIREGETYALPRDLSQADALGYWFAPPREVFVALDGAELVGTYFIQPNHRGGGAHVANCGYMTGPWAINRGVASAMCEHSLEHARQRGYRAMQYNLVVSSNGRAVRLWKSFGFAVVGTLPEAFTHPRLGYVDAFVMYRAL